MAGAERITHTTEPGISLRDYFAGQALAGFAVSESFRRTPEGHASWAAWAYEVADAMLQARKRPMHVDEDET